MFDAANVKDRCVQWIRDFFEENGKGCNAVIGISGGKDSSVVAALSVAAYGRENVYGVLMPNGEQADIAPQSITRASANATTLAALPFCILKPNIRATSIKQIGRHRGYSRALNIAVNGYYIGIVLAFLVKELVGKHFFCDRFS